MDRLNEYSHNSFDLQSLLNSFPGDLEFKQIFSDIGEQMQQNATRTSLHSVEDYSSVDVKSVWDDVRLHLRRFLVNRLESHNEINNSQQRVELKNQCMKQLLLLYPESEVLIKYQNIQKRLLAKFLQNSFPSCNRDSDLEVIAHGYQSTMPMLYSMIKEDFNILCEILAPSSIVQFIKETYLDTVTEEMAKILENFCELQLKENAVSGVKTSKSCSKHSGTVHALVSSACPQKPRRSSLSLDELKFLSQLTQSFLKLESNIQELLEETFLLLQMPRNSPGILEKSNREAMVEKRTANETNISPEPLLPVKEATLLEFGWRNAFKDITLSMAHCISAAIEGFSTKVLQQEQTERTSASSYIMNLVNVPKACLEGHIFAEEEQPKQFCSDIMEKLDTMLPLALACRDDSLQEIRGNLVEACCKVATAVLERLQERGRDIPSGAPLKNLHILLSTAAYVSQHFTHYDNLMRETTKKPVFLVPVQRYQEFINTLQFQVTDYCVRVCATSILQDAESHHWDDYKAFYEV
ncbi:Uncharacterized protein KIAA0825-like [Cricetulus griseus]|uniref:Uncharacterized protein KIAA0825-like n=1 Tax=Cricetulus griseus TaxID=10029 RepID=G3HNV2_CRIGR|nr:Uncharacterized protein KIAA0825-like [Cricetulus griseus]